MSPLGIQVVLIAFAVFALSRVLMRFRSGGLPLVHLLLWSTFWGGFAVVVLHPEYSVKLAAFLNVGRGVDLAIYLAIVLLFYIAFRLFGKIEDLERQITRLVRANALRDLDPEPGRPSADEGRADARA